MKKGDCVRFVCMEYGSVGSILYGVITKRCSPICWDVMVEDGCTYLVEEGNITPLSINVFDLMEKSEIKKSELKTSDIQNAFTEFDRALLALHNTTKALKHILGR